MISDLTQCIDPTGSGAGVNTFVSLACFVGGTIWVDYTLWSTCNIWISKVFRDTLAGSSTVSVLTNCIWSTRRGVARIYWCLRPGSYWNYFVSYIKKIVYYRIAAIKKKFAKEANTYMLFFYNKPRKDLLHIQGYRCSWGNDSSLNMLLECHKLQDKGPCTCSACRPG